MAGCVPELKESTEVVGGDLKGVNEDGSNVAVPWDDVQGSGTDSDSVCHQNLGVDGGDVEYPGGISPTEGQTYCRYNGKTWAGWDVVISPGGGGTRSIVLIPHTGVHSETVGNHCDTGGTPLQL